MISLIIFWSSVNTALDCLIQGLSTYPELSSDRLLTRNAFSKGLCHDILSYFPDVKNYFQIGGNLESVNLRRNTKLKINKHGHDLGRLTRITKDKLENKIGQFFQEELSVTLL